MLRIPAEGSQSLLRHMALRLLPGAGNALCACLAPRLAPQLCARRTPSPPSTGVAPGMPRAQASAREGPSGGPQPLRRFDSHLHVWASPEESKQFPFFPGQEPQIPGDAAFLIQEMDAAGVDGALIIQPINHKFDHSYVSSVLRAHPERFVGCCLANPAADASGVPELRRLLTEEGYRAVRFNPYLWLEGEKMSNGVGRAMFSLAGELGAPVGFMCFKGLMLHIEDIEELCTAYPGTRVMMDHFGFCRPSQRKQEPWKRLLGLARFPQVYVKCSAFFRLSEGSGPPYEDTWPMVQDLLDAYGSSRLLWGSDFPFVVPECGYGGAWNILPEGFATEEQMQDLMSSTAHSLLKGA